MISSKQLFRSGSCISPFFLLCIFFYFFISIVPNVAQGQTVRPVRHIGYVSSNMESESKQNYVLKFAENDTTIFNVQFPGLAMNLVLYRPHNFALADPKADFYMGHVVGNQQKKVTLKVTDRDFFLWFEEKGALQKLGPYEEMERDINEKLKVLAREEGNVKVAKTGYWIEKIGNYGLVDLDALERGIVSTPPNPDSPERLANCATDKEDYQGNSTNRIAASDTISNIWVGKRHVKVAIWIYDDSFDNRSNIEYVIFDALSDNHNDASNHWLLQDLFIHLSWKTVEGGQAAMHNEIPWNSNSDVFLISFRSWILANGYHRPDKIDMLGTENGWDNDVLGLASTNGYNPDSAYVGYASGIASDDDRAIMAHEISHVLNVNHTSWWYDGWWHADLMYFSTYYWADHPDHHHYNSSYDAIHHSLRKNKKYPDKTIELGVLDGTLPNHSYTGTTSGESTADHLGRVYGAPNKVYKFQVSLAGNYGMDIQNTGFDTYLYVLNGTTGDLITKDDDSGPGLLSRTNWIYMVPGIDYVAIVSGAGNAQGYYGNFLIWSQFGLSNSAKGIPENGKIPILPVWDNKSDLGYSVEKGNLVHEEGAQKLEVDLYPNPATDYTYLSFLGEGSEEISKIQIHDMLGRKVWDTEVETMSQVIKLPLVQVPKGTYIINLLDRKDRMLHSQKILRH